MKKYIIAVMVIMFAVLLTGCNYSSTILTHQEDWVSPDGVHYWIYAANNGCAMSPRLNPDGTLFTEGAGR